MFRKEIDVIADSSSWPSGKVPVDIAAVQGTWSPDLLVSLIHTALWTRPPMSSGIHLSDFWAWLRYHRAISEQHSELRLCEAWADVDPHQKTILSDELGVGFTTHLLAEKFECLGFVDTSYLQNHLKAHFSVKSKSKRGSSKSPDYVAIDTHGELYILECKGTQTSRKALEAAIMRGKAQKGNLSVSRPSLVKHSLVAGLFVPQWKNKKAYPCIMIADPTWQDVETMLEESPPLFRHTAFLQIMMAKHFSLIGLSDISQALVETDAREFEFTESMQSSISSWLSISMRSGMRILIDTEATQGNILQSNVRAPYNINFMVGLSKALETVLITATENRDRASRDFRTLFEDTRIELFPTELDSRPSNVFNNGNQWGAFSSEFSSTVTSPLGFKFFLEMTPANREASL